MKKTHQFHFRNVYIYIHMFCVAWPNDDDVDDDDAFKKMKSRFQA